MFIWSCTYDNGASDWKDSYRCLARCRKPFKSEAKAQQAANAHSKRTGHKTVVVKRDGRKLRKWSKR